MQNLRPYSLRHTAGTRWAEENWGLPKIQKALGQRKLDTTQKYLHMSQKGVKEMIDNDRLAMPYRKGVEIVKHYYEQLLKEEERYSKKVMLNIKKSKNYRKIVVTIEAID
ncbi:MAG: tyrosine-type recombinase/integrase [Candidatus Levyibacteriota bacterium]